MERFCASTTVVRILRASGMSRKERLRATSGRRNSPRMRRVALSSRLRTQRGGQ